MRQRRFISFEGIDGSGKSTQAKVLATTLEELGHDIVLTREPGGSIGAEEIRSLVLQGDPDRWSAESEILLFTAARRDHLEKTILPALDAGKIVICDRFTDSTHVYQGYVGGVDNALLDGLDQLSCQGLVPDLTLLLDMDSNAGLARTIQRGDAESRFESKGAAFHQKVRQGFVERAEKDPDRIAKIDAARPADAVTKDVIAAVRALLVAKGMIAAS